MHWIAVSEPGALPGNARLAWRALRYTPRVAQVDEALVLEVSGSHRLWGGPERLLRHFLGRQPERMGMAWSQAGNALVAIALLRMQAHGAGVPLSLPDGLPLSSLSAARPHLDTLARMGCNTWSDARALPRAGLAQRFGSALLAALDIAWGMQPECYPWLTLPEVFDEKLELPALATSAAELLWAAHRLMGALQGWLRARQRGVRAFELEWTLDLRRIDGVDLPGSQRLMVRTARSTQGMAHLRRMLGEQLARVQLAAPANGLRLRAVDTAPWQGSSTSLLPQDQVPGGRLHELIERLSARLGADCVRVPLPRADHRPECMQQWVPAADPIPAQRAGTAVPGFAQGLYPSWLLREPLRLEVRQHVPHFHGPLERLTRAQRIETGWWESIADGADRPAASLVLRDYFIARSAQAGWLWIYRERPAAAQDAVRWFLHGIYA